MKNNLFYQLILLAVVAMPVTSLFELSLRIYENNEIKNHHSANEFKRFRSNFVMNC